MYDIFFHYNIIGRSILYLKQSKKKFNYMDLFKIKDLLIFFNLKDIIDINSIFVLNYIYFFKYYFGCLPLFFNYSYKFKLNLNYFSFIVQYKFNNKRLYFPLYFFLNDIYGRIKKINLQFNQITSVIFRYEVKDMNFFLEQKNSLGFFNLKHSVCFEFIFSKTLLNFNLLFSIFKFKL
jgi:hypothetical protein